MTRMLSTEPAATRVVTAERPWATTAGRNLLSAVGPLAVAGWLLTANDLPPARFDGLGLINQLPATFWLWAVAAAGAWLLLLVSRAGDARIVLALVSLVVILYGALAITQKVAPLSVAWRHVGISRWIEQTQTIDPNIDAYFNWPGFFITVALFMKVLHVSDLQSGVGWAPLGFSVAYAFPLWSIYTRLLPDRRTVHIALFLFYVGDWIGQDYFSPQGAAFLLYLVLIALVLRMRGPHVSRRGRVVSFVLGSALILAIASSHQLTPVQVVLALAVLAFVPATPGRLLGRRQWHTADLFVAAVAAIAAWDAFMAHAYLSGHFHYVFGDFGHVSTTVNQSVASRVGGLPEHVTVTHARIVESASYWAAAAIGFLLVGRRYGPERWTLGVLAVSPIALVAAQSYGGEIALRVQFFAVPFLSALAAVAATRLLSFRVGTLVVAAAVAALLPLFVITRYGNAMIDTYTPDEVRAVQAAYDAAPVNAAMLTVNDNLPWKFDRYASVRYVTIGAVAPWPARDTPAQWRRQAKELRRYMATQRSGAYVLLLSSEDRWVRLFGLYSYDAAARLRATLVRSPGFRVVFDSPTGTVITLRRRA